MKKIFLSIGVVLVALIASLFWWNPALFGKTSSSVSIKTDSAPPGKIIPKIERQTGERILVDPSLDDLVSLKLKEAPLPDLLDRLSDQLGGRWTTVYAVHKSDRALKRLEPVLQTNGPLAEIGWTNLTAAGLAPVFAPTTSSFTSTTTNSLPGGGFGFTSQTVGGPQASPGTSFQSSNTRSGFGGGGFSFNLADGDSREAIMKKMRESGIDPQSEMGQKMVENMEGAIKKMKESMARGEFPSAPPGPIGHARMAVMGKNPDGSPKLVEEDLATEKLLLDLDLLEKMDPDFLPAGDLKKAAQKLAAQVGGKVVRYYVVQKTLLPASATRFLTKRPKPGSGGAAPIPSSEEIQEGLARQKIEDLQNLSPEQRARQARQIQSLKDDQ